MTFAELEPPSSEPIMRFFTPELYTQFNSSDDGVADHANEAWENALQEYHCYRRICSCRICYSRGEARTVMQPRPENGVLRKHNRWCRY